MTQSSGSRGSSSFDPCSYEYLRNLAKPGFAWEFARRNGQVRRAAVRCRAGAPVAVQIGENAHLYRLRRRFRTAETFGLYHIPDPDLSALQTTPFWMPEALDPTIALRLSRRRFWRSECVDLAGLPGAKHVLVPIARPSELVLLGKHYAGYFMLGGRCTLLSGRFFMTVQIGAFGEFPLQLSAAEALFDASRGIASAPWHERAFGPNRLRRALIAYDIRTALGGSHWDAARALYGVRRIERARREGDDSLRERARRAFAMGEKFVAGGYRHLLR